eukprot:sb/3477725/
MTVGYINKIWGAGAIPGNSYVSLEHPLNLQVAHSVSQCTGLFCLPEWFPHHFGFLGIHLLEYLSPPSSPLTVFLSEGCCFPLVSNSGQLAILFFAAAKSSLYWLSS